MIAVVGVSGGVIPVLVALVGSTGLLGGIAMFVKLRPERDSLIVGTAQAALAMQKDIEGSLRLELNRATERLARVDELEAEVEALRQQLHLAKEKIARLEQRTA